jgi:hypothetical protein
MHQPRDWRRQAISIFEGNGLTTPLFETEKVTRAEVIGLSLRCVIFETQRLFLRGDFETQSQIHS